MNYGNLVDSSNVNFEVHDHVVKYGKVTWQIINIATTTIEKIIIPFNEPEPYFGESEPSYDVSFSAMFFFGLLSWIAVRAWLDAPRLAIFAVVVVIGITLYVASVEFDEKKSAWLRRKNNIAEKWNIWNTIRQNPPVLYCLILETNAGQSKPLFYSFHESQITKAQQAIEKSMEKKTVGNINFQIETVNVGGEDSINNFGSSIYKQAIRRV